MPSHAPFALTFALRTLFGAFGLAVCSAAWSAGAADHGDSHKPAPAASGASAAAYDAAPRTTAKTVPVDGLPTSSTSPIAEKIRAAMSGTVVSSKKMTVTVEDKEPLTRTAPPVRTTPSPAARTLSSRSYSQARAAAVEGRAASGMPAVTGLTPAPSDMQWSYDGASGPQAWGKLKPDFNVCANGKRQSPINIEEGTTLQGPAEPVQFAYTPSNGTVVNNGRTIQVDVQGENAITVRGSTYRLAQILFHTPSEVQINFKRYPMVAHLMHRNNEGQIAIVAVLLDEGAASPAIDKIWTYMPLDNGDRVRMPTGLLNLTELLPTDQRYFQFMGSLTTPPCTEGVLWLVLKQPVTISRAQYKLFTQLYPANARPVQPLNGRPVREAQ